MTVFVAINADAEDQHSLNERNLKALEAQKLETEQVSTG